MYETYAYALPIRLTTCVGRVVGLCDVMPVLAMFAWSISVEFCLQSLLYRYRQVSAGRGPQPSILNAYSFLSIVRCRPIAGIIK